MRRVMRNRGDRRSPFPAVVGLCLLGLILFNCFTWSAGIAAPLARRQVLENGLTLLVSEQPALPIVAATLLVRAGTAAEPEEKAGLAYLTGRLLTQGTQQRSALQIAEEVEFVGASLGVGVDHDSATIDLRTLKKDLGHTFGLLADILLRPTFPQAEVDRVVRETRARLLRVKEDPGEEGRERFDRLVFGRHPYGRPVEGTEETLGRIGRADLAAFHAARYRPAGAILAVAGDVTLEEMAAMVRTHLGTWSPLPASGPAAAAARPEVGKAGRRVVEKLHRPISQAKITLGHLGISRDNPDYYAVLVMNFILGGGGSSSRLMATIRQRRGLAYDVQSAFVARREPGAFLVSMETKNSSAREAIDLVMAEIERLRSQAVEEAELEAAKAYLTGSFPLRLDTNAKLVRFLTAIEYFGLGLDFPQRYPELIDQVSRDDILRVARQYLHPDNLILVVVANQDEAKLPY